MPRVEGVRAAAIMTMSAEGRAAIRFSGVDSDVMIFEESSGESAGTTIGEEDLRRTSMLQLKGEIWRI